MKHIKTLGGAIDVFEDCWEYPENTIKLLEGTANDPVRDKVNWESAGYCDAVNLSRTIRKSENPIIHKIYEDFRDVLTETIKEYIPRYNIAEDIHSDSPYQFLRFKKGQGLPRGYNRNQTITALLSINGEMEVVFPTQNIWIKFKPNMMIIFPSNFAYQFESREVTKGNQYAILTFLNDGKVTN
jgi:hypothetical protein